MDDGVVGGVGAVPGSHHLTCNQAQRREGQHDDDKMVAMLQRQHRREEAKQTVEACTKYDTHQLIGLHPEALQDTLEKV